MTRRPRDQIRLETEAGGLELFQSLSLTTDLFEVSTLVLTFGDDGTWSSIDSIVTPGEEVQLFCNGLLQFTGRFEVNEGPVTAMEGTTVQVVARTKMADAKYASADPKLSLKKVSIGDFVRRLYEPLGYGKKDFVLAPATDRDIMTGKKVGARDPVDLEPLKVEQAKVEPPEAIFDCAAHHLKRHHLMHWDAADGRILVGVPDDEQDPLYRFLSKRGIASEGNNVLEARRLRDWSEVASDIWVFGGSQAKDVLRAQIRGVATDLDLARVYNKTGHFYRPVVIPSEGSRTQAMADAAAKREMAARARRKDAWEVKMDGWSFWNGSGLIPYAINTTSDVDIETVGARTSGRYLIAHVTRTLDAEGAATSTMNLLAPGILVL